MKYKRFEELPVWQAAMELALRVEVLTSDGSVRRIVGLTNQLMRAALSVSNNIAEGFERGSTSELLMFIYIARGSAGEVRSMLHFCDRTTRCAHLRDEAAILRRMAESCSRQLRAWADSLQNSPVPGPRHLNNRTRAAWDHSRREKAFLELLKRTVEEGRREREGDACGAEEEAGK